VGGWPIYKLQHPAMRHASQVAQHGAERKIGSAGAVSSLMNEINRPRNETAYCVRKREHFRRLAHPLRFSKGGANMPSCAAMNRETPSSPSGFLDQYKQVRLSRARSRGSCRVPPLLRFSRSGVVFHVHMISIFISANLTLRLRLFRGFEKVVESRRDT
jgi:hypothetical protein